MRVPFAISRSRVICKTGQIAQQRFYLPPVQRWIDSNATRERRREDFFNKNGIVESFEFKITFVTLYCNIIYRIISKEIKDISGNVFFIYLQINFSCIYFGIYKINVKWERNVVVYLS